MKIFIPILIFILFGCNSVTSNIESKIRDVANNMRVVESIRGVNLDIQYLPMEYLSSNKSKFRNISKENYEQNHYFLLEISGDVLDEKSAYLDFSFEKDLFLIYDMDTIPPSLYHHEDLSSINGVHNIVTALPKINGDYSNVKFGIKKNLIFFETKVYNIATN